ncbi:MAG: chorismate-binding protein [Mariprofundaceae bacterium]|nr:chorismate-binding protein [Mariprofundaceae bacterium]
MDALSSNRAGDFFDGWKRRINAVNVQPSPCIRQLIYAAYEAAHLIERLPQPESEVAGCVLWTLLPDFSLCLDMQNHCVYLAAKSEQILDDLQSMLDVATRYPATVSPSTGVLPEIQVTDQTIYKRNVQTVRDYIAAGDVFQANIARFWTMPCAKVDLTALYGRLRAVNAAPFSCFVRVETNRDTLHIQSASPERLFRINTDGIVDTRPIAGTRRRGTGDMDEKLRAEMLLSDKERAEHIMLVDLERNDLGRVCVPGSVEVNETMTVEAYATVQHIVSNVRGRLRDNIDLVDVFRAMFPGGTITGCPKVRCMQIIHELEGQARGPYTGGVGFLAWDGSADMNILIRTFWHHQGRLHWAAGAGIVADSDAEFELCETGHKAEGLMRALAK